MYQSQLESSTGQAGCEYLANRFPGIPPWELEQFGFGYVADPAPGDERFHGRLVLPYITPAGIRGVKFRCIRDHNCKDAGHGKYDQPHGQAQRIYNPMAYFNAGDTLGVCEGEIDAATATVSLGLPTIGIPGATQWDSMGKYWSLVLADSPRIIIFADGDDAGRKLASKIASSHANPVIVYCDPGNDVNSMVVKGRGDVLKRKAGLN